MKNSTETGKRNKILFIMHMPPPVHGASMMGKYIHDSKLIDQTFDCQYINLTLAKDLSDIGKGGFSKLWSFLRQMKYIASAVHKEKPRLCYVTPNTKGGAFYKDFIVVMLLKAMGQNVIAHYHNKGVVTRQDRVVDDLLYKHFFKNQKVILLANALYKDIEKYVARKDVYICPNGIPQNGSISELLSKKQEAFKILFLSNMMVEKGVWDLLEACRILKEKEKEFHCDFVGKWNDIDSPTFHKRIQEYGLENYITAHGSKYGTEKEKYLRKADLFVFPTYYNNECFPLVLLEAMEYSLPCISTNEGGITDIIEESKTGYIVEKQNPKILAQQIEYLLDHPELRKQMGQAGKNKFQKEFTLEKFEERMKAILEEAIYTK